jgi:rubredoxin
MTSLRILIKGGSIAPNDLRQIAGWAQDYGLSTLEVSNRQEILLTPPSKTIREDLDRRIKALGLLTGETDPLTQNIVSSLPATDVFADTPWLTAGVYLDILAQFRDINPRLKINLIDPAQSLVSPFTGNINFIASPESGYWYVFLRPSGSVRRYAWPILLESESIGPFVQVVETHYFQNAVDTGVRATAETFYRAVMADFQGNTRKLAQDLILPDSTMSVYEGFHRGPSGNYWLGLFRKSFTFPLAFVEALCNLCRETRVGQLYLTPYKTLIIKEIRDIDRPAWDRLLGRFGIRTNVPAWHLNWQLPNTDSHAFALKNQILHQLEDTDVRTDELSFAVKVPFSEAAAQVVIQQNGSPESFDIYQRASHSTTNAQYVMFAKSQSLMQLGESIRQLSLAYYERLNAPVSPAFADDKPIEQVKRQVYECPVCLSRYDAHYGEPHRHITPGTSFEQLATDYTCDVCETEKSLFVEKWLV